MKLEFRTRLPLAFAGLTLAACAQPSRVYFGTSHSRGIYVSDFDSRTGKLSDPRLAIETEDCGFIVFHPGRKLLYSTGVSAFKINEDGTLAVINTQSTEGGRACHVNIDA